MMQKPGIAESNNLYRRTPMVIQLLPEVGKGETLPN
jgi:hypothetical protein